MEVELDINGTQRNLAKFEETGSVTDRFVYHAEQEVSITNGVDQTFNLKWRRTSFFHAAYISNALLKFYRLS